MRAGSCAGGSALVGRNVRDELGDELEDERLLCALLLVGREDLVEILALGEGLLKVVRVRTRVVALAAEGRVVGDLLADLAAGRIEGALGDVELNLVAVLRVARPRPRAVLSAGRAIPVDPVGMNRYPCAPTRAR